MGKFKDYLIMLEAEIEAKNKEKDVNDSAEYKEFVKKQVKEAGYETFADIPQDKLDDFWKMIDSKWNSEGEEGKDGEVK